MYRLLATWLGDEKATSSEHFDAMIRSVGKATLTRAIASALRSEDLPQVASRLFNAANPSERVQMLSCIAPELWSHANVSEDQIQRLVRKAEQQDSALLHRLSSVYAGQPALLMHLDPPVLEKVMHHVAQGYS